MRNNQRRASARTRPAARAKTKQAPVLSYEVPTEFVELPSRGAFYPQGTRYITWKRQRYAL